MTRWIRYVRKTRIASLKHIWIARLDINSIRDKFEMRNEVAGNKIDILLISDAKLDDTFSLNQFILEGFTPPYRLDSTSNGGGLMLFTERYTFKNVT